jgi:ABC-2 type transport system permease protein
MDAPAPARPVKIKRWLPYWAVFQADVQQTLRNWVYRTWVLVSLLTAVGYLLYRYGVVREAKIIQPASDLVSDLLRWTVLGSATLIIMLTAGSISSERGTMADSVLSRGISRHQYFLGKWHARLATVLATYLLLALAVLTGSFFLLNEDLSFSGSLVAVLTVGFLLAAVVTSGVTVSAITNSTAVGITVLWIAIYGTGFSLSLLPEQLTGQLLAPDRMLSRLPNILRGWYNLQEVGQLAGWSVLASAVLGLVGLIAFSRRDV